MTQLTRNGMDGSHEQPIPIQATCVYWNTPCYLVGDKWYFYNNGFYDVTDKKQLETLEQWYKDSQNNDEL